MRTAVVLLVLAAAVGAKADPREKHLRKLAQVWVDYARWLKVQGHKAAAEAALAEARAADAGAKDLDRLAADVAALAEDAPADAALEKRRAQAHKAAAKVYDRLAKAGEGPAYDAYLFRAIELEPSKARVGRLAGAIRKGAGNRREAPRAARLLVRARAAAPDGPWDKLELEMARDDIALVRGEHPMVGWLSLPKGWKKGGSYPVLVAVEGAGSNFLGAARGFAGARGSRPWIVLAPCGFANTNALLPKKYPFYDEALLKEHDADRIRFDLDGLQSLLKVVAERYGGEEKIGITGFSGGGNLCYAMTILHPDRIRFSAPACANFSGQGLRDAQPVEGGGPPVFVMTGADDPHREFTHGKKDSPGIEPQTDNAMQAFERLRFTNVERTMLKGVGHSALRPQVWDHADRYTK